MTKLISRRGLLHTTFTTAVAGAVIVSAGQASAQDKVCADPSKMDSGQKSFRTSMNYVEVFTDPKQSCAQCGFFQPSGDGCGACAIFNGPANAKGHCDSWGAKG